MGFTGAGKHIIKPAAGEPVYNQTLQNNWAIIEVAGLNSKIFSSLGVELHYAPSLASRKMKAAWVNRIQANVKKHQGQAHTSS
jgi:hypothetical protein